MSTGSVETSRQQSLGRQTCSTSRLALLAGLLPMLAWNVALAQADNASRPESERVYDVDYQARFVPEDGLVEMQIKVSQPRDFLRQLRFNTKADRYQGFTADGVIETGAQSVTWRPPARGGTLRYSVRINHERKPGAWDSLMREDWAIFRGDDLVPPAAVTTLKGAESRARLRITGPRAWSLISAYPRAEDSQEWFAVDWPDRAFDRPVGWMTAGKLGVRWGDVEGIRVAIAGPVGHGIRRLDMLAFLRWNLPSLVEIFPHFPKRILLVSGNDPMWRGGLSGPHSLFIHADRPLISANGTSTLLHELMHLAQGYSAVNGDDWIVEGIAEFYTLEIMRRSGTLSDRRFERGIEKLEHWSEQAESLAAERASGSRTARAVAIMQQLDTELRKLSKDKYSLDDVARKLAQDGKKVSRKRLREVAETLAGRPLKALSAEQLGTD